MKDKVESRSEKVQKLGLVAHMHHTDHADLSVVEMIDKKVKKNLLKVNASTQEKKATYMKDDISQALKSIQITNLRFTIGGNIVMNFNNENRRADTAKKLVC